MGLTLKDLIQKKDYDYISWYITLPEDMGGGDTFWGATKSVNGELISLDGDIYSEDVEVLKYEEWKNEEEGIANGLRIVIEGNWKNLSE